MTCTTSFVTSLCYPSIIVYKTLPWQYFDEQEKDSVDKNAGIGVINLGIFLVFNSLGSYTASAKCLR